MVSIYELIKLHIDSVTDLAILESVNIGNQLDTA
jgi:hypothetical protein